MEDKYEEVNSLNYQIYCKPGEMFGKSKKKTNNS
jgi:hypothetical protein